VKRVNAGMTVYPLYMGHLQPKSGESQESNTYEQCPTVKRVMVQRRAQGPGACLSDIKVDNLAGRQDYPPTVKRE